jgi:carboxyl-terminal processing protease
MKNAEMHVIWKDGVFMKRRDFVIVLLCLLILSNIATYIFTRFFFSSPVLQVEVAGEKERGKILWEVWDLLEKNYFEPLKEEELLQGAIRGMVQSLGDPHTAYLPPESMEELLIHTTGSLSGIGVEIVDDEGDVLILRVLDGSPAGSSGLLEGDRIVEVDGKSTADITLDEVAQLLRGLAGTEVEVAVQRAGEEELFCCTVTRADIEMDTVFSRVLDGRFGYIKISSFDQDTGRDFCESLKHLEKEGIQGLVLDLRDNPGGLPEEAIEIAQEIVPSGEITRVVDRDGNIKEQHFSQAEKKEYEIIVLVNEHTASAAEIIAGSLQDRGAALLIGKPTYGKATMQCLQYLGDGGGLRYTIAKYLTPSGSGWHGSGLQPDYEVELPLEYYLQYISIPRDLKKGDTGEKVILLQSMLHFLGYPLEKTGIYDQQTISFLIEFQKDNKLPETGELDISTRERLRNMLAEKAEEVDEQLHLALKILKGEDKAV